MTTSIPLLMQFMSSARPKFYDFESAPLWPLRYLSVCWFGKPTLKLYHIIFGFASVLQNFIIRYLNVFVRTHFYSAMVLAIEHFLWRYPLRMQGKIIPIGLSSRNPSRTSFRMTRPAIRFALPAAHNAPGNAAVGTPRAVKANIRFHRRLYPYFTAR